MSFLEARLSVTPSTEASPADQSRANITMSAIFAGVCALSPVPFIDDLVIGAIRRHMVGRLFRAHGVSLSWGQRRALTRSHRSLMLGCMLGVLVYPIRKIFRKVFYLFAVKEAVDVASRLLHQGVLVEHALTQSCIDPGRLGEAKEPLERLNRVIQRTCEDVGASSVSRIFERSFAGGRVFMRRLGRQVVRTLRALGVLRREDAVDAAPDQLQGDRERGVLDDLRVALLGEAEYFEALQERFDVQWAKELETSSPPSLGDGEA